MIIAGLGFRGLQCFELFLLGVGCVEDCGCTFRCCFDYELTGFDRADFDFVSGFETVLFEPEALEDDAGMAFVFCDCQ